jgi:hypothetical protein
MYSDMQTTPVKSEEFFTKARPKSMAVASVTLAAALA